MYFKLSFRNVKRSFKDYAIYFLTLTFAVCLFYSFNSLSAQQAMMDLSKSQSNMIESAQRLLSGVSVFVAFVLGFLILFANNFLIKRRKKELGLYMTLGMGKRKISQILIVETFFIGLASLAAGLILGTLLSQGLSILTAGLFKVDVKKYEFIFSSAAMVKTMLYFGIMFLFVMVFNTAIISKYKLIDLLTAARKNQQLKIRKTSTSVILFILSLVILGISYAVILKYGLFENMNIVWMCVGLGALGTFLFFLSLSGFLLNVLQRNKKLYFKDINMFVLRQINSKVNTTFVSMSVICLMLFFTIGVLSTSFSYKASLEKDLDQVTPYDVTIERYASEEATNSVKDAMGVVGVDVTSYGESVEFSQYSTDTSIKELLLPYTDKAASNYFKHGFDRNIEGIKRSDYNALMKLQGKNPISLKDNEVLLLSNMGDFKHTIKEYVKNNKTIVINNKAYPIVEDGSQSVSTITAPGAFNVLQVVLPDEAVKEMKPERTTLNIQYNGDSVIKNEQLYELKEKFLRGNDAEKFRPLLFIDTKNLIYEEMTGMTTTIVYIGIYLGIVFLISSAAILALQQLSEASENMERYNMLKKIGVTEKGINKSIFRQILIYFMMPLSLAIVHSIFGIKVVSDALVFAGKSGVVLSSFLTAGMIVVVYGAYFFATYTGYKSIVK